MKKIMGFILSMAVMGGMLQAAFINDPAPQFSLKDRKGTAVALSDFKGQVVFINFWASWCPPCKKEFPEINELANEYKDHGVKVVAISVDKSSSHVDKFLGKLGINPESLIILLDPSAGVVANYVARSMPSSFIVDKNGVIRYVHFGYSDKDPMEWRKEIEVLRKENTTPSK